jgi:hypothetical protein
MYTDEHGWKSEDGVLRMSGAGAPLLHPPFSILHPRF